MEDSSYRQSQSANSLAIVSLVSSVLAWVVFLLTICANFLILPIFSIATLGVGLLGYLCTLPVGCITPLGWIVAVITGHISVNQIQAVGGGGDGLAKGGLISGYVGLGLTLLALCFFLLTGGIPFLLALFGNY